MPCEMSWMRNWPPNSGLSYAAGSRPRFIEHGRQAASGDSLIPKRCWGTPSVHREPTEGLRR